ncbi:MAG: malto-oligosyltrehalose synthase [Pirellulales bacterium]
MFEDPAKQPQATYRVQLHRNFDLTQAAALADYFAALGISHVYASPVLQAAPGSMHGYDVLDHRRVNIELGGEEAFNRFCQALVAEELKLLLDIVPNHMSIAGHGNAWWWDVLENGPASRFAHYFDVDWSPPEAKLKDRVLIPILGDHYGRVVEAGEIVLVRQGGRFTFHYHEQVLPVAPRSLDGLLQDAAARAESDDLAFIADAYGHLPLATETDWASVQRRHRDKLVLRAQLERLCQEHRHIAAAVDEVVRETNGSPDEIDVLLERQNYRLAFWRTARDELDYRRFFDVNFLVGLRTEDERVFHETHARVLEWARQGFVAGLRVDHPDGLNDPEEYFHRLRHGAPESWIVAEKILMTGERLPETWPVQGTTGYDFASRLSAVLVDPEGEQPLTDFYGEFTGEPTDFEYLIRKKKLLVLDTMFGADQSRLAELFAQVCERHRRYRDYTRRELRHVLRETIACTRVYRSYVRGRDVPISEVDQQRIEEAIEKGKQHRPDLDGDLFDFLRDILLLRVRGPIEHEFVMQFQQQTGPVMAKGVEDTTFYNFNRLVALNEVGGDPGRWSLTPEQFHEECCYAQGHQPFSLLATTTHDTKRSEDVRARLLVLAEIPARWAAAVREWSTMNESFRHDYMPDRNTEYFLYQTLVGAWPISQERLTEYMIKAMREAKAHTSWTDPQAPFEEALARFIETIVGHPPFLAGLQAFVAQILDAGRINSLAQTLLKITTPGVPDFYQGSELWDLSLVDPDNRRPVDYSLRRRLLEEMRNLSVEQTMERADEGLSKLWLTVRALDARRRRPDLLGGKATYRMLEPAGAKSRHVLSYLRGDRAAVVVPRFPLSLDGHWNDTTLELPAGRWINEITGDSCDGGPQAVSQLLRRFPVALFIQTA